MPRPSYLRRVAAGARSAALALVPARQAAPEEARPQIAAPAVHPAVTPAHAAQAPHPAPRPRQAALATPVPAPPAPTPPAAQLLAGWMPGESPAVPGAASEARPRPAPLPEGPPIATDNFPAGPVHTAPAPLLLALEAPADLATPRAVHKAISAESARITRPSLPGALPLEPALPRIAAASQPEPGFTAPILPPGSAGPTEPFADRASSSPFAARPGATPVAPRATTSPEPVIVRPLPETASQPAVSRGPNPVEVRIGTIEIRAPAATPPAPIVPPPQPLPAPAARPAASFPRSYSWRYGIAQA
jgi:hypothetical protein